VGTIGRVIRALYCGTPVVAKVFHPNTISEESFIEEMLHLSRLKHPNIVFFVGATIQSGEKIMMNEWVGKDNVRTVLNSVVLNWEVRIKMAVDIANGLQYLHSLDPPVFCPALRSYNILIEDVNYTVKISDYGFVDTHQKNQVTCRWSAPEVLKGSDCSAASDVYSVAVIYWELLCGKFPYAEIKSEEEVKKQIINGNTLQIPTTVNCPETYSCMLSHCWSYDASLRPTVSDIIQHLEEFVQPLPPDVPICYSKEVFLPNPPYLLRNSIVMDYERPVVEDNCPEVFAELMRLCWDPIESNRTSFDNIVNILENGLKSIQEAQEPRFPIKKNCTRVMAIGPDVELELPETKGIMGEGERGTMIGSQVYTDPPASGSDITSPAPLPSASQSYILNNSSISSSSVLSASQSYILNSSIPLKPYTSSRSPSNKHSLSLSDLPNRISPLWFPATTDTTSATTSSNSSKSNIIIRDNKSYNNLSSSSQHRTRHNNSNNNNKTKEGKEKEIEESKENKGRCFSVLTTSQEAYAIHKYFTDANNLASMHRVGHTTNLSGISASYIYPNHKNVSPFLRCSNTAIDRSSI